MAEKKFEFRRLRDVGESLGDTFAFIRQESGPLLKSFFAICGIFILLSAVLNAAFQSGVFASFFREMSYPGSNYRFRTTNFFTWRYFLAILSTVMAYTSMQVALFAYIKAYLQNDGASPGIEQVWNIFGRYFLTVLVFNIPVFFMTVIGYAMCLVPGIYFSVVFAPFALIVMLEEVGFGEAFNRCFLLIRHNFWPALATYLLAYIIYYVLGIIVGMLVSGVYSVLTGFTLKKFAESLNVLTSLLNVFSMCFYIVPLLTISIYYFNLVEIADGTGIMRRIDSIGEKRDNIQKSDEDF